MIRTAKIADATVIAQIHVSAWKAAYKDILPNEFLEHLSIERRAGFWSKEIEKGISRTFVWEHEGEIMGWINFGNCRDEGFEDSGEIYAIYVEQYSWGMGIGFELMQYAHKHLFTRNHNRIYLWVLEGNKQAIEFYKRLGYQIDHPQKEIRLGDEIFVEQRYILSEPAAEKEAIIC